MTSELRMTDEGRLRNLKWPTPSYIIWNLAPSNDLVWSPQSPEQNQLDTYIVKHTHPIT